MDDFCVCLSNVDAEHIDLLRLFNFGEPLLHSDVPGLLKQVKKQKWNPRRVEISTSGQYFDNKQMLEILRTKALTILAVSCDGNASPEEYEKLRPPARWEKLIEFVRKVGEMKKRYSPQLVLIARIICTDLQNQKLWKMILNPFGWKCQFRCRIPLPESQDTLTNDFKAPNALCSFLNDRHPKIMFHKAYVSYDGTVISCCRHPKAGEFGNLKFEKLSSILSSDKRKKVKHDLQTRRADMRICGKCEDVVA